MTILKFLLLSLFVCLASAGMAQENRGEIRGIRLGMPAATMSTDGFTGFACGSDGGPPGASLTGWTDFRSCHPEANGLHEVYFRFDDLTRPDKQPAFPIENPGTRIAGHPVILSVLFSDAGTVQGIRIVTDPRASLLQRRMAQLLRLNVIQHYGEAGWTCIDQPPAPGETPVGNIFIKQRCDKITPEHHLVMQARLLRKPGQAAYDPTTQDYKPGQFESMTRLEIWDPSLRLE
jgi:hypothetical protein